MKPTQIDIEDNSEKLREKLDILVNDIYKKFDSMNDKVYNFVTDQPVQQQSLSSIDSDNSAAHASTHESGGIDAVNHDSLTGFVANEHLPAIDEDDMISDSTAYVPTQQSVKAYVDNWAYPITVVTTTYIVLTSDYVVICNSSSAFTVTLFTAVSNTGQVIHIKNKNTGIITLEADGSETIDGALNQTINQYENIQVISDGTEWWIL